MGEKCPGQFHEPVRLCASLQNEIDEHSVNKQLDLCLLLVTNSLTFYYKESFLLYRSKEVKAVTSRRS